MNVGPYQTWLFDCDGVLLDSNAVKTDAFYELARPYGTDVADALVAHHRNTGGVSRFVKVRYLFETLLGRDDEAEIQRGIARYGELVEEGLRTCAIAPGVHQLLNHIPDGTYRAVISGGLETEVRAAMEGRGLAPYFDSIHGSPATKEEIFQHLRVKGLLAGGAVYFGDSRYDYVVAEQFDVDVVFVSGLSEFKAWRAFFQERPVPVVENLGEVQPLNS